MSRHPKNLSTNPSGEGARFALWLAWIVAGVGWSALVLRLLWPKLTTGSANWPEALLLIALSVVLLGALLRQLPLQNIALVTVVIAFVGGVAHGVGAATGIPFGPLTFAGRAGAELFGKLPLLLPLLWIVMILSSRGVARLVLRPWRKLRTYGYWLIGFTVLLTTLLVGAMEPFASRVQHYWLWGQTRLPVAWHGAPVTSFLGWALVTLLIMAFITPALINKKTSRQSPPDYHPLAVWLLLDLAFAIGGCTKQLWSAVIYCGVVGVVAGMFAIRGGKW